MGDPSRNPSPFAKEQLDDADEFVTNLEDDVSRLRELMAAPRNTSAGAVVRGALPVLEKRIV